MLYEDIYIDQNIYINIINKQTYVIICTTKITEQLHLF